MSQYQQQQIKVVWRKGRNTFVLRYWDPDKGPRGGWREVSAKTNNRKKADKSAGELLAKLSAGDYQPRTDRITWECFRERYRTEKLVSLARKTAVAFFTAANHLEAIVDPRYLDEITPDLLSRFQAKLRLSAREGDEYSEATIASYLRAIRAAVNWAADMGMIRSRIKVAMPKRAVKSRDMRGRPPTESEFRSMLKACEIVRPQDSSQWQRYLMGLYLSGLRLEESMALSWDPVSPISVDLEGAFPQFRILAEGEKGNKDRLLPMAPEFAQLILDTPIHQRHGAVFAVKHEDGSPWDPNGVSKQVAEIGRRAGVIVDSAAERFATAHDLRRAFGTRWARRVTPAVLKILMRHKSIETTMKYYVGIESDDVAGQVWASVGLPLPTSYGESCPEGDQSGDHVTSEAAPTIATICHKLFRGTGFSRIP